MTGFTIPRRAAALLAAGLALAALQAGPARAQGLVAGADPMARTVATADLCVSVVVERAAVSASCVKVPPGSTGAQVLIARAKQLGRTPPRFDNSGLVCAIDGYPETGCAEASGGGFSYWSYWHKHGSGGWQYSSAGAFLYTVGGTQPSEGWAWIEGEANRPPASPSYASVCPPSITNPSPAPSPPLTFKAAPKPPVQPSGPVRRPTANPVTRQSSSVFSPTAAHRAATAAPPVGPVSQPGKTEATVPGFRSSPVMTSAPSATSATPTRPGTARPITTAAAPPVAASSAIAAESAAQKSPGGGASLGLFVGLALVLCVGAAAAYQVWRRRARP